MNINLKKKTKNNFKIFFFKLMNCSVFGKTMENIQNRDDIRLVMNDKKLLKLVKHLNYVSYTKINNNLFSI